MAVRNALKFDPVQILFGDYQLYYEVYLTPHSSIEAGFGPTRRNYAANWFDYELDNLGSNVNVKTRFAFTLVYRRYFWADEELFGPYMSAGVNYRRFDKTYDVLDATGNLTGASFDDSRRYSSVMVYGGYQALSLMSNIFADFYIGVGLRYKDFDVVRSYNVNNPDSYRVTTQEEFAFGLQAGVKIGVGF